jgi:hypothetical protein
MDALANLLDAIKKGGAAEGNFLGLLHVLIGRSIRRAGESNVISKGATWREVAALLKKVRWEPEAVREIGLNPDELPPRDRQRYWYSAIAQAKVDSANAISAGDRLADALRGLGYEIGSPPH